MVIDFFKSKIYISKSTRDTLIHQTNKCLANQIDCRQFTTCKITPPIGKLNTRIIPIYKPEP